MTRARGSPSTPWAATAARRRWSPARSRALRKDPTLRVHLLRRRSADRRRARQASGNLARRVEIVHSPEAIAGERKAEPGDPPRQDHLDGHGDRRGEGGPRRRGAVRRQHRRADGDGQARAAHDAGDRPARARRAAADARRHDVRHARPRRQHRMRRAEPGPVRGHGRGLCAHRARHRPSRGCGCSTSAPRR